MNIDSIYLQQSERISKNSALRKAAAAPVLPKISEDEMSMINKKFAGANSLQSYTSQGKIQGSDFFDRGHHIDRHV
ncbi:MAG: hypothetical protein LAT84_07140 [Balneolia bacterium]|nr:hypothetical protein [Balneolia bacterium]